MSYPQYTPMLSLYT